jgi:hypothetical protein
MKLREKTLAEVLALGVYKAIKSQKRRVRVFIPSSFIPPTQPYRTVIVETEYGRVKIFTHPSQDGGWVVHLTFPPETVIFNPVLSGEAAKKLREKLQK